MGCDRSVIIMTLLRFDYLVHSLSNRAMALPVGTNLSLTCLVHEIDTKWYIKINISIIQ